MPSFRTTVAPNSRQQILSTGQGFISESVPHGLANGTTILTSGTVAAAAIGLRAGDVVTNIIMDVGTGGSGQTLVRLGLYSSALALLGQTANVASSFTSTGVVASALSAAYFVPADGLYYAAVLGLSGTQPIPLRQNATTSPAAYGSNPAAFGRQASQSDLPTTMTMSGGGAQYWFAVS